MVLQTGISMSQYVKRVPHLIIMSYLSVCIFCILRAADKAHLTNEGSGLSEGLLIDWNAITGQCCESCVKHLWQIDAKHLEYARSK